MAAFAHLPRRLTKLYSDTKQDINAEQAKLENVPELNALHRRFRIQRDRLIAWGMEWSDNSSAASQGSIDESVAQAGLTETVTSVLGTIQDILDEADRIKASGDHGTPDAKGEKSWTKSPTANSWTAADKARYEDLARDLTTSIDTLYDLSRARRISNPSTNPWRFDSGEVTTTPVLIEYAGFDPVYRMTGVPPPLNRLEGLLDVLARGMGRFGEGPDAPAFGTLKCLGYFEDHSQPRFGFVFELPSFMYHGLSKSLRPSEFQALRPVTLLSVLQSSAKNNVAVPNIPALEKRFRIALNLVISFSKLHASGFVHKDVNSSNILLFRKQKPSGHSGDRKQPQYELQSPYVCSFDLFSEFNVEVQPSGTNIYRHPHDPRTQDPAQSTYAQHFDMYGLALILLEIGLWVPLSDIFKSKYTLADFKTIQRAWRKSRGKMTFQEYRRKVVIIQNQWRERKVRQSAALFTEQPRIMQRSIAESYPTPGPDITIEEMHVQTSIKLKQQKATTKRKLLVQPLWRPTPSIAAEWDQTILPRLMRICEKALRDSPESSSIDLFGIGSSPSDAKATIVVTCASTAKVKAVLAKKFNYDRAVFDLKVHKGKIRRSKLTRSTRKRRAPFRSMMDEDEVPALNGCFQQRPICGASIGAYNGEEHLPPVSYGGVVLVDGETFGMSVHHMLDAPSEDESEYGDEYSDVESEEILRSSARVNSYPWISQIGSQPSLQDLPDTPQAFEISDDEDLDDGASSYTYDSADEAYSDSESEDTSSEPGDVPGIEAGDGEEILITQPAIDDVDDDFFPCEEDRDEDHIDSHELGHVHASSGIRRWNRNGVIHEIDWSLLKLKDERLQPYNLVQGGKRFCARPAKLCPKLVDPVERRHFKPEEDEYPSQVAKAEDLGSLQVHSLGRTSGLKGGVISHTMTAVKIHGRKSYARSWHVSGGLGVGGDSGAWVIDNEQGRICGHILAWCDRNHVAYICPMQVLLEDIKRTLGANKILLPGQEEEETMTAQVKAGFELPDIKQLNIGDVDGEIRSRFLESPSKIEVVRGRTRQMA
ncbi:hypothetical protein GTA08_BOTSDO12353 [Neofusicoccum parvum]|nr:hypothetical protein GTA08_BOTSDO12353 [Neofusicoccum parvum]